jgi:hypothetical protein
LFREVPGNAEEEFGAPAAADEAEGVGHVGVKLQMEVRRG